MKTTKLLGRAFLALVLVCGAKVACQAQDQESEKPQHVVQTDEIYEVVEELPKFGNGDADLMKYLSESIKYPKAAQKKNQQGRVVVQFVVESDGSVAHAVVKRSVTKALDQEALRVVRAMPKWTPGKEKGRAVRVRYSLPISFRLK